MKETTCKKLQEVGFALAGGCTRKRMNQLVEMIRAARDYRWVGVYKIIKDEFVIMAESGTDPRRYARFPITQGLCGAALDSGKPVIVGDVRQGSPVPADVSYNSFRDHCADAQRP